MMEAGMTTPGLSHLIALAACVVLTAAGQVCLRCGAAGKAGVLGVYLAPLTLLGYLLFGLNTLAGVYAMQAIDLKTGSTWSALAVPLVVVASRWWPGEALTKRKLIGCGCIVAGVAVFHSV